jgi:hypothetical protein
MVDKIKQYAKFIAALIGAIATAFTAQIPGEWQGWITSIVAALTAISVLAIPNAITTKQINDLSQNGLPTGNGTFTE